MPKGITIEQLEAVDIDQVAPLWKALLDHVAALPQALVPVRPGDESWRLERKEMLEALAGDGFALVARRDGRAVGYLFVRLEGPDPVWYTGDAHAELAHLSVAAGERRHGVGGALMDAMDAELERRGVDDVEIGVDTGNEMAVRLYEGRGYRPDFRIFYGSPGRKPWACLAREEEDKRAGRGRFAAPGAGAPSAAGAASPRLGDAAPSSGDAALAEGASPSLGDAPLAEGASPSLGDAPLAEGASPSLEDAL
jgi:ribosomal protein S18 acetylase RimI-like enzyme